MNGEIKCQICGGPLPKELPTFPKLYNMSQEQKDRIMAEQVHATCCSSGKREIEQMASIPVLVSFLNAIQKELREPTGCGDLIADSIEAVIMAHSGKRPEGAFGELFDVVKSLGLKTSLDCIATDSCKATTETIKP